MIDADYAILCLSTYPVTGPDVEVAAIEAERAAIMLRRRELRGTLKPLDADRVARREWLEKYLEKAK